MFTGQLNECRMAAWEILTNNYPISALIIYFLCIVGVLPFIRKPASKPRERRRMVSDQRPKALVH